MSSAECTQQLKVESLAMNDLTTLKPGDLVDPQAQRIVEFLGQIGLPSENIIAPNRNERKSGTTCQPC